MRTCIFTDLRGPRRLVSLASHGGASRSPVAGLADRLLGTTSAFYYALLTRRAFQVQTFGEVPSFEVNLRFSAPQDALRYFWRRSSTITTVLFLHLHLVGAGRRAAGATKNMIAATQLNVASLQLALAPNRIDWRRSPDGEELLRVVWNDSTPAAQWEDTPFGPGVDTNRRVMLPSAALQSGLPMMASAPHGVHRVAMRLLRCDRWPHPIAGSILGSVVRSWLLTPSATSSLQLDHLHSVKGTLLAHACCRGACWLGVPVAVAWKCLQTTTGEPDLQRASLFSIWCSGTPMCGRGSGSTLTRQRRTRCSSAAT